MSFELLTVREYNDNSGGTYTDSIMNKEQYLQNDHNAIDEVFYRIVGNYTNDSMRPSIIVGTYLSSEQAYRILQDLTGKEVELHIF